MTAKEEILAMLDRSSEAPTYAEAFDLLPSLHVRVACRKHYYPSHKSHNQRKRHSRKMANQLQARASGLAEENFR